MRHRVGRVLIVPDMHLWDKNPEGIRLMPTQSYIIVDKIYEYLKEVQRTEDRYDYVVYGGDLQHGNITSMEFYTKILRRFKDISDIMAEGFRLRPGAVESKVIKNRVLAMRGQHDDVDHDKSGLGDCSLYDSLIYMGYADEVPDYIVYNDRVIMFFNNYKYKVFDARFRDKYYYTEHKDKKVIGVYHNNFRKDGSVDLGGRLMPAHDHGIFTDVDVAIFNDIHTPMEYRVVDNGMTYNSTLCYFPGSLGRSNCNHYHMRDHARMIDLHIYMDDVGYYTDVEYVHVDLIGVDSYFE